MQMIKEILSNKFLETYEGEDAETHICAGASEGMP